MVRDHPYILCPNIKATSISENDIKVDEGQKEYPMLPYNINGKGDIILYSDEVQSGLYHFTSSKVS